ncbi:hypothetical protein CHGG_04843 [Chaetomium globosum CBS 148.51]|uniref:Uncharacterized protein n=1 Tax=Chaetomium globosum (strain ATCC 6205 / CBS 148.51 / DSM 1962 / NBRC 6347 / NRRL 1970) TaxID=306901 RepID=Q2H053_CHAGB|nr:uncharacterized protein CHGG_04843 [Chaetomium globosum CBS 148.51]EAQ88224.1 hypothetical protein CHGG_04843 [Chaetomium globosum CBS 148.51]
MAAPKRRDYQNVPAVDIDDDDDLIDPDDADLNTFDDPLSQPTTSRTTTTTTTNTTTPGLTGSIGSRSSGHASSWTSRIPGEDRTTASAASPSTIDESVWATLRRDLLAVWRKLLEVLYPRHLFAAWGGPDSLRGAYASLRSGGFAGAREELAGLAGRVLDAESLLGGGGKCRWEWCGRGVCCGAGG